MILEFQINKKYHMVRLISLKDHKNTIKHFL